MGGPLVLLDSYQAKRPYGGGTARVMEAIICRANANICLHNNTCTKNPWNTHDLALVVRSLQVPDIQSALVMKE